MRMFSMRHNLKSIPLMASISDPSKSRIIKLTWVIPYCDNISRMVRAGARRARRYIYRILFGLLRATRRRHIFAETAAVSHDGQYSDRPAPMTGSALRSSDKPMKGLLLTAEASSRNRANRSHGVPEMVRHR